MKIVFINTVANSGSTGKIVTSLYHYLDEKKIESEIVFGRGTCRTDISSYKVGNRIDFLKHVCRNFFRGESGFGSRKNSLKLINYLTKVKPDIIHLHNIHGFYLNCEILFNYFKKENIKVVWTLHDCWPFTGHCAYFDGIDCDKWKTGCYACPQHRTAYPYALFCDNSMNSYKKKKDIFQGVKNLTIVTPSYWLADIVKDSFLSCYSVEVIHNGIDKNTYKRKKVIRELNLVNKKIILGVANVWEKRKGLSYFEFLADNLDNNYQIVLAGLNAWQVKRLSRKYPNRKVITLKRTRSVEQLCELYSMADVYVNPTIEDNYPTTNMEALSCGTPVITFDTGGCGESVDDSCGIVVEKGNTQELLLAIKNVCQNNNYNSNACIEKAESFDSEITWKKYLALYESMVY